MGDCGSAAVYSTEILEEGEEGLRKYRSLRNLRRNGGLRQCRSLLDRTRSRQAAVYSTEKDEGEGAAEIPQPTEPEAELGEWSFPVGERKKVERLTLSPCF